MKLTRILLPLALLCLPCLTTGCFLVAAAGAGAGGVAYMKGAKTTNEDAPIKTVHTAAVKALSELEIKVRKESVDTLTGKIEGRTADGKDVIVNTKRLTDSATELTIRVGPFGDEPVHTAIYDKIKANL